MKHIKKFNEGIDSESFIEDIKQIVMPLIDEGFSFRHRIDPNYNDRLIFYEFFLHKSVEDSGRGFSQSSSDEWIFSSAPTDKNEREVKNIEELSNTLRIIGDNISEIVDRLSDLNQSPEMTALRSEFYMEIIKHSLLVSIKFSMLK